MPISPSITLCADDFGLSDGIDLAILDLIGRGRLSATSCMMAGRSLETHAAELTRLRSHVAVGLHVTFTDLPPLGPMPRLAPSGRPPSLNEILVRAFTGRLDYAEIEAEIRRQIDRFKRVFGVAPDFVDGHQHVHLLPVIRRALLEQVRNGELPAQTAIRNCSEPGVAIVRRGVEVPKTLLISVLSTGLSRAAAALGMPTNDSFRGVTAFAADPPFGSLFRRFLTGPGQRPLVMCHPGLAGYSPDPTDVIASARIGEYAYLASDQFAADLVSAGVAIARPRR